MPRRIIVFLCLTLGLTPFVSGQEYEGDFTELLTKAESKASEDGKKILETGKTMTLVNAEILPGSCWDYANAVYDRAGYSWGKRETVFKSVKAGPFVEANKIKNGDWLYYINHSYGDIEHSAIFVEWIDFENKLALMLSYGGEKRQQPARYLPYDLTHVYGITRANSKLGEVKNTVKSDTNKVKTNTSTNIKNTTSVNSSANASNSTANSNTSSSTVTTSVSGGTINGMKIDVLKFGSNIANMEVVGESTNFISSTEKVFCWMRVSGGQGKAVKVRWFYNGNSLGDVQLDIRSNSMRTYAFRTINGKKGDWKVEVVDPSGNLLHSAGFTIN